MTGEMPFRVEAVTEPTAMAECHAIREEVFVRGQQVPADLERDGRDGSSRHVVARDLGGAAIGTGRLTAEGRIGRMAVLETWRNRGVGAALLHALLRVARDAGLAGVGLNAQVSALAFYARHGFAAVDARFMEAGIEHQAMQLLFALPLAVADRATALVATCEVVQSARRRLWICSHELDPGLLDQREVLDGLRRFATARVGASVQVLLHDAAAPQRAHAPLLSLAQRLPSVFAFRELDDPVDRAQTAAYIVNDAGGYYHRGLGHRIEGEADRDAGGRARQLADAFRPLWERSRPVSEYRALGL